MRHLPQFGYRRRRTGMSALGYLPTLPDGTWIQRQPGQPDQVVSGPPPDLSIPYLSQTISLIADGVYAVPGQPAGSTNWVQPAGTTLPPASAYSSGIVPVESTPTPGTMAYVLAAEAAAQARAVPIGPPVAPPVQVSTQGVPLATPVNPAGSPVAPGLITEAEGLFSSNPILYGGLALLLAYLLFSSLSSKKR